MGTLRKIAVALAALTWLASGARASETFRFPEGEVRRDFVRLPSARLGEGDVYEAMVVRPARGGTFPLVVLNHGAPRDRERAKDSRVASWTAVAIEFARQGYVAAAFLRQGFGASTGRMIDSSGSCNSPDYIGSGGNTARQIADAIAALKRESYVDASRIVVAGQSAGGFGSLALAARPPEGAAAVLNFAGGRGSPRPDEVCNPHALVDAIRHFGASARLPTLWVYAQNDHFFGPKLAGEMFDAWSRAGAKGEFVAAPEFGEDGHMLFGAMGIPIWRGYASAFLAKLALPAWTTPPEDAPAKLDRPNGLGKTGTQGFEDYRRSTNYHKAFAMGDRGRWTWQAGYATREEAADAALRRCTERGSCRVVFIDDAPAN